MKKILLLLAFVTLSINAQEKHEAAVSVTGEGIVRVVPDEVALGIRVEHTGKSAKEVKNMNDAAVNNVLQFCKKMGIDRKDVHTQYLNLNKNYDYQKKEYQYVANQAIRVMLHDLDKYEALVQGLLDSGVNRIDGIQFKISKMEQYESEARKKAVLDAQRKAGEYAGALGQSIGKAISISETMTNAPMPVFNRAMELNEMAGSGVDAGGSSIAVGEMKITVRVHVMFDLR